MSNLITEETTKEEHLAEYKNYPAIEGNLQEKPFYESRYAPIFYEIKLGSKVLDLGCNDGVFMEFLKERRQCEVKGVDISEVALKIAKDKGLDVQIADAEKLPFADKSFDAVVCMEVLSHLLDPIKALKEIRRVLKKDGVLLGSTPHKNLESYAWEEKRMHRRYYDITTLTEDLEQGGFKRAWIKTLNGGQFAMSLATSFLGDKEAEMLFKCGGLDTLGWDEALQDKSILRCWMGFTQTPGTVYYRMQGFADKMQKIGAEVHYNPYDETDFNSPAEWITKIKYLPHENRITNAHIVNELETILKAADLSVFQLTSSRDLLLVLMTARLGVIKKPMWMDMDDWMFDLPSYNLASNPYQPNSEAEDVTFRQIKLADGIICSTQFIKDKLNEMFPGKPVHIVKNAIDFDIWDNVTRPTVLHDKNPDLIRIGYTGCGNHSGDMELIKEPILALLEEFPNLEFVSLPFPSLDDITHPRFKRFDRWVALSKFPQMIADMEFDIGIAPLRDNNLNRAKSNLRWLEYSALKIPSVMSDIYPFHHSVNHGKDGLLVKNSNQDWYDNLRELIVDKKKRTEMGQKAYSKVKYHYNMEDVARGYLSVLKSIKSEFLNESKRSTGRGRKAISRRK